jgi:hypothetical protein
MAKTFLKKHAYLMYEKKRHVSEKCFQGTSSEMDQAKSGLKLFIKGRDAEIFS